MNSLEDDVTKVFKVVFQRLDEIQDIKPDKDKRKIGLKSES